MSGAAFLETFCTPDPLLAGSLTPSRIGQLLFAAVHAARQGFERWIWLLDIHRIVSKESFDWSEGIRAAQLCRARGPLYASLLATRELLRTPLPRGVLRELAPAPLRRHLLRRRVTASLVQEGARSLRQRAQFLFGETWWEVARGAARAGVRQWPGDPVSRVVRAPQRDDRV